MSEAQIFVIPLLEMEEIMTCIHEGMLGDGVINILPEHIKNPTPAVMMQLCTSILGKLGVEVGALCQARLNSSMQMKHPDLYINVFKLIHVSMLMGRLIPMLDKSFTLNDLTTPRHKRVRKFICTCINYFKSWADNGVVWEEKYSPSATAEKENRHLRELVASNEAEISSLKVWQEEQRPRRQELTDHLEKSQQEVQLVQKRREEKDLLKQNLKKNFKDITSALEKKQKEVDTLSAEKGNLMSQVVDSPKRHMERKHTLSQKLKVWEQKQAEAQGNAREAERVTSVMENMGRLITDSAQTAKDNKSIKETIKKTESEIQSQCYEIENHRLTILENSQEVTNLKQQIVASRDKISRMTVRSKQRTTEHDSEMSDYEREKKILQQQAGKVHSEVIKAEEEIKALRNQRKKMEEDFSAEKEEVEGLKKNLMAEMDKFVKEMHEKLDNSEVNKALEGIKRN